MNILDKLILGTAQFGMQYGIKNSTNLAYEDVNQIIKKANLKNIDTFDTALAYGDSESRIGKSIVENKFEGIKIYTKIGIEDFKDYQDLAEILKLSLERLKIDRLEGLLIHTPEIDEYWSGKYQALFEKLLEENLVKKIGVSVYTSKQAKFAFKIKLIKDIQLPFNIFDQRILDDKLLEIAKIEHKTLIYRSIFLQGLLGFEPQKLPLKMKFASPYLEDLVNICNSYKISVYEAALKFVSIYLEDNKFIIGIDNLKQLEENITVLNKIDQISDDLIPELRNKFKEINNLKLINPSLW